MTLEELQEYTTKKLRTAFALGKTWWQQADSEYRRENKKAEETEKKFEDLIANTLDAITFELKRAAERTSSAGSAVVMSDEQIEELSGKYANGDMGDFDAVGFARAILASAAPLYAAAAAQPAQEPVKPELQKTIRSLAMLIAEEGIKEGRGMMQAVASDRVRAVVDGVLSWDIGRGLLQDLYATAQANFPKSEEE